MAKVRMRVLQGEPVEKPGASAFVLHMFELIAHVEQEGEYFAGCVEGFDGTLETVGGSEKEVVQGLCEAFSMLTSYHIEKDDLWEFLTAHDMRPCAVETLSMTVTSPSDIEREFTYMPTNLPIIGGVRACGG